LEQAKHAATSQPAEFKDNAQQPACWLDFSSALRIGAEWLCGAIQKNEYAESSIDFSGTIATRFSQQQ